MSKQNFDLINLKGLIDEDLVLYNKIMTSYYDKISKISTISRINCNINISSIILNNTKNCIINLKNKCFSNVSNGLNLFIETIIENEDHMSMSMKMKIEKYLGISFDKQTNIETSTTYQKCNAFAGVTNNITVQELEIDNCNSFKPLEFNFYNTGDASSNCGIIDLSNALGESNQEENIRKKYDILLNKVLNLNLNDLMVIILLCIIIYTIIIILYLIFKTTNNISYIYRFKKKN